MTLVRSLPHKQEGDTAFQKALDAGATLIIAPGEVFRVGNSGDNADPDGHAREGARNLTGR